MRVSAWAAVLLLCSLSWTAGAAELEERLERLEAQMERLLRHLEAGDPEPGAPAEPPPAPASPPREPDSAPAAVPAEPTPPPAQPPAAAPQPVPATGEARVRYYLSADRLGDEPPAADPLADGLFRLEGELRMDPFRYGAAERRLIGGGYRDPSLHRSAGILLEGWLEIPNAGVHRFELTPKPARDRGESAVSNAMTIRMWVDGTRVLDFENVQSWRRVSVERTLPAGRHPFRLWVVSNSPGFGAPPIDSQLGIEVVMPGRAELAPLWRHVTPP